MTQKIAACLVFLALSGLVFGQNSWNVDLLGQVNRGDTRYSGSWAYVAPDSSEYALIGAKTGMAAYSIDDTSSFTELGFVAGPVTNWREITVIGQHAFVVTDVQGPSHGMQVIDLGYLPDSLHLDTTYTETFTTGHIIQKAIDSDEPYVYVMGTSTTQGVHILNVSDPAVPVEVGKYVPGYYIHDAHIRGNLLYAAAFYETQIDIVDISDKTNPVQIGTITYDGKNTHSASTTEDGHFLIVTDEQDGYPARVFNVEDPENGYEVARYTANELSLVHNPYVRGDFCFVSHNTEGLRVLDLADPSVPVEVGFFDTWPGASGGFSGLWSACPYFPSGKIIGGNRNDGLYVWSFNETRAARVYGLVTDSLSGAPIYGAAIEIPELADTLATGFTGQFKKGMLEGSYTLAVTASGYLPKTLEINLLQGDSLFVEMPLVPENFSAASEKAALLPSPTLYPNPSGGSFSVDLSRLPNATQMKVFDEKGGLVKKQSIAGGRLLGLDFSENPVGHYRLAIFDEAGSLIATARISMF
ncbi:MAG: choice-of-anchor B family protein [Bacteroidetes bacterium]|nr:choice-of-anchor B family protein [Bacteroidota bacterium]